MTKSSRQYNGYYRAEHLNFVAFPLGGIGAGMFCVEGTGALSHLSLRHKPDIFNEPCAFSAVCIRGPTNLARVLEGPVPKRKAFGTPGTGNGGHNKTYGLPRFQSATFRARFPFCTINLQDRQIPLDVTITGWSPFIPGNAYDSCLPVAALEYTFRNRQRRKIEAVYSFNTGNFMATGSASRQVLAMDGGFILHQDGSKEKTWEQGDFGVMTDAAKAAVNCAWFRGHWFDALTAVWQAIESGQAISAPPPVKGDPSPGASLCVPFTLKPGEVKTIRVMTCWYVPKTEQRCGKEPETASQTACAKATLKGTYVPWYAGQFNSLETIAAYWRKHYTRLRQASEKFSRCFYDSTLPPEFIEAVAANLTILKTPTILRQADGRLWAWEGCGDAAGCCAGSCTHVWNYAQALPHLFPELERTLRETEFFVSQNECGHQMFRSGLPIRPVAHDFHPAADGQLGGIMKVYREWRIGANGQWLRKIWPRVKASLDYCIQTWDPDRKGILQEPHHNTYDIEFWGPDGMCGSFYLGALQAAISMGEAIGADVSAYRQLLNAGRRYLESKLYDGEYFIQKVQWKNIHAPSPATDAKNYSPEALKLLCNEGPKYQYGRGCLADGVLGAWIGAVCGVPDFLDAQKVKSHLLAVYKHNFKKSLVAHVNPQRPTYAFGADSGLLLCTWPKGGRLSLPFVYSEEVWTGIEYQVASHLLLFGRTKEALNIVRAVRDRYDGRYRNPFNEYECGHWYARAMSSYGLLQGFTGARYDAVTKTLHISPAIKGDFRSFLCTENGYGTVGLRKGRPFFVPVHGNININTIILNNKKIQTK